MPKFLNHLDLNGNQLKNTKLEITDSPLAEEGDATAQINLGVMYEKGEGVPQDYKAAANWYKLSAEQGYAKAQYNLGVIYDKGQGVLQDYMTAGKWNTLAAAECKGKKQVNLG